MSDMTAEKKSITQWRGFAVGASLSVLVISSFFVGAWADRVFVVRPVDYFAARSPGQVSDNPSDSQFSSKLGALLHANGELTVADVAEVASDSVVTVAIKTQQRVIGNPFQGLFGFPMEEVEPEIKEIQRDIGSGFVVDSSGLIVTNKHVVSDATAQYKIIDTDDKEYEVTRIYRDPTTDLAILKVEGATLSALHLGDSSTLRVGEPVIAIGTALGEFRHTVTTGVISGLGRGITAFGGMAGMEELEDVIQTDAAINPGNSGGPLLNNKGVVIGVNVAVSANAQNVGFALPINVVKDSLSNFNQTGQFDRPFFGVRYRLISQEAALANEVPQGAYIQEVVPNSTAQEAGLQVGDILTKVDGVALKSEGTVEQSERSAGQVNAANLAEIINKKKIGDTMQISYWREGQTIEKTVTLRAAQ
jgi:S1-C subfamily serine protease